MYNRRIREEFWTTFGKYMALVPSATGEKVNWINYKTGVKFIQFKMDADDKKVELSIEINHPDELTRLRIFQQLLNDRQLLESETNSEWQWNAVKHLEDGRQISRVFLERTALNVYLKADWPAIISFFKPILLGLDRFWSEQRDLYEYIA
jgi:hypothetical protein